MEIKIALEAAEKVLRAGGVAAIPTDTVYGFAALVHDEAAIAKLYKIKERDQKKSIAVLLGDAEQAHLVAHEFPAKAQRLAAKYWPGALTIIIRKKAGLPGFPTGCRHLRGNRTACDHLPGSHHLLLYLQPGSDPLYRAAVCLRAVSRAWPRLQPDHHSLPSRSRRCQISHDVGDFLQFDHRFGWRSSAGDSMSYGHLWSLDRHGSG